MSIKPSKNMRVLDWLMSLCLINIPTDYYFLSHVAVVERNACEVYESIKPYLSLCGYCWFKNYKRLNISKYKKLVKHPTLHILAFIIAFNLSSFCSIFSFFTFSNGFCSCSTSELLLLVIVVILQYLKNLTAYSQKSLKIYLITSSLDV